MASIQNIVGGPSKWDLMQSLFTGEKVSFTLESGFVVEGVVTTLHNHSLEDTIVEDLNFTYAVNDFHDWLVLVLPSRGGPRNFYVAAFEYHEKSRTGAATVLTDEGYESLRKKVPVDEIYYMPNVWTRMLDPINYR
jgi:hypothetical protein